MEIKTQGKTVNIPNTKIFHCYNIIHAQNALGFKSKDLVKCAQRGDNGEMLVYDRRDAKLKRLYIVNNVYRTRATLEELGGEGNANSVEWWAETGDCAMWQHKDFFIVN